MKNVQGNITFENVGFHYSDDDTNVLSNINLNIKKGNSVALVGPSGGGKTTLCNLIPRFYDVTEGRILIDGKDIKRHIKFAPKFNRCRSTGRLLVLGNGL